MKIKVLGASGSGESGRKSCAFLVDGFLLLDAGTAAGELSVREEDRLRYILLTHAHLDHVKGIPFLLENRSSRGTGAPITVMGGKEILGDLRKHIFNNRIWPDFAKAASGKPLLCYKTLNTARRLRLDGYTIVMERVSHTVPANGYIVESPSKKALACTGDTGPADLFWKRMEEFDVKALITETSFPNRLEELARATGHLTPAMLEQEIKKMSRPPETILVAHLKPRFEREIKAEIRALRRKNLRVLESGEQFGI